MIWTAHIDESGTHDDSPIMLMGGYLGNEDQWKKFDADWKALLASEGVGGCHAKELMHSAKEFEGWGRQRRDGFLIKAAKVISDSLEFGFTAIIRQNDYEEIYKGQPKTFKLREDTMYGIPFSRMPLDGRISGNRQSNSASASQVGHRPGARSQELGDAKRLFYLAKKEHLPGCEHVLGTFTLGEKSILGLQAADLLVYGANRLEKKDHWTQPTDIEKSSFIVKAGEPTPPGFKEYRFPVRRKTLQMLHADFLLPDRKRKQMQE